METVFHIIRAGRESNLSNRQIFTVLTAAINEKEGQWTGKRLPSLQAQS
jgi:hypothetical protein